MQTNAAPSADRFDVSGLVARLLTVEGVAIVTITAPLDRRRPGNDADRIQLQNLVTHATRELRNRFDARLADTTGAQLSAAVSKVETDLGADGTIIISAPEGTETHRLPFPVPATATVATTPATRALIRGLKQSPRSRALVVSDHAC